MADQTEAFRKIGEDILDLAVEKHFMTEGMFHPETGDPLPEDSYEQNFVVGSNNWETIKDSMGPDLPDLFSSFGLPDPDKFGPILEELEQVLELMHSNTITDLHSETLMLDGWTGFAIDKFRRNYISDWYDKVQAHRELAKSFVTVIYGCQKLYTETHQSVSAVGESAMKALGEVGEGWNFPWSGKSVYDLAMTVAGLAVAVLAASTGGLTVIGAAGLVIQGVNASVNAVDSAIKSTSAMDVINETRAKLGEISGHLAENERVIAKDVLELNIDELSSGLRAVLPPEPDLASIDPQNPGNDLRWRSSELGESQ